MGVAKVLDEIEIPTYTVRINGTLFPPPDPAFSRQEPSEANDIAWEVFENIRTHVVTRDAIVKLGKDPDTVARFDDEYWGLGQNAYMAQLDIFHVGHQYMEYMERVHHLLLISSLANTLP